jgi:hypothetical protein
MNSSKRLVQSLYWLSAIILMNLSLSCFVNAQSASDDVIHLKNGTMIRGTIFERVPNSYIKIKTLEGKVQKFKMSEISKIAKADGINVEEKPSKIEKPIVSPTPVEKKMDMKPEQPKPIQSTTAVNVKSPTTAFLLSLVLPGGGQYYNGQYTKGAIMTGTAVAGIVLILAAGYEDVFVADDYYYASYGYWTTESTTWLTVGTVLIVGSSVWSIIDAPITAKKINERKNATMGHMFEIGTEHYIVGCDIIPMNSGLRLTTTFHF